MACSRFKPIMACLESKKPFNSWHFHRAKQAADDLQPGKAMLYDAKRKWTSAI
jgi:hypothetical protein